MAQKPPTRRVVAVSGHTSTLNKGKVTPEFVRRLKVPAGFRVSVFTDQAAAPRMIAVGDDGTVYTTRRDSGDVLAFRDDGSGRAGAPRKVIANMPKVHGIAINGRTMYVATVNEVYTADIMADGSVSTPRAIITNLPDGGQHQNRTLGIGPDGMLYITVGSTCNQCQESREESATMLRAKPDGSERGVFASGLRNTIGFAWHPVTKELWGMDHGMDWKGDGIPHEKLNRIQSASNYGWPFCYEDKQVDYTFSNEPPGGTKEEFCPRTVAPVLKYTSHAAPMQMAFYTGTQFPAEYRNDAFIAMRGSWNREPVSGYRILRIHFENGQATRFDDFLTGFVEGSTYFARPVGVAVAKDGSLLIGDDTNGMIYRVTYAGGAR